MLDFFASSVYVSEVLRSGSCTTCKFGPTNVYIIWLKYEKPGLIKELIYGVVDHHGGSLLRMQMSEILIFN